MQYVRYIYPSSLFSGDYPLEEAMRRIYITKISGGTDEDAIASLSPDYRLPETLQLIYMLKFLPSLESTAVLRWREMLKIAFWMLLCLKIFTWGMIYLAPEFSNVDKLTSFLASIVINILLLLSIYSCKIVAYDLSFCILVFCSVLIPGNTMYPEVSLLPSLFAFAKIRFGILWLGIWAYTIWLLVMLRRHCPYELIKIKNTADKLSLNFSFHQNFSA
ncbi:MAG: hypothetical protein LWX56_00180 [Ignavibacteria bacterium]|nr:hypothetical protein [Ignavibacteria bacterium]